MEKNNIGGEKNPPTDLQIEALWNFYEERLEGVHIAWCVLVSFKYSLSKRNQICLWVFLLDLLKHDVY